MYVLLVEINTLFSFEWCFFFRVLLKTLSPHNKETFKLLFNYKRDKYQHPAHIHI